MNEEMKRSPTSRSPAAFTLIELLAVIGIIGVLAALLFPAIKTAILKSEISQAQGGISNLSTAFKAYYTEYGQWPITDTTPGRCYVVDANMVALLSGGSLSAVGPTTELGGVTGGPSGQFGGNPRKIPFLQFKQSDLGNAASCQGCYLDPWKKPYFFALDVTYVNTIPDPFDSTLTVTNGCLIWSDGPDGQESQTCGDPPGPYHEPPLCVNRDNVKSW
jgi:prepilin-type N-terminal cleavage/methylation domain-containing protein